MGAEAARALEGGPLRGPGSARMLPRPPTWPGVGPSPRPVIPRRAHPPAARPRPPPPPAPAPAATRPTSLFTVYGVLLRAPGFTVRDAPTLPGNLVLNLVLIYSLFIFAIVLGAGIEEVKTRLEAVRSGDIGLRLQQHVLVLNW
jgi:hypothetical protein